MAKIIDNYILIEAIGQGTFGEIHKGRNLISKEAVAVKTIRLDRFLNDTTLRDMIINEIQALKKLEDSHVVRMIKMLKSANNIYLVYEFLNGGSLEVMLAEKGHLSEQEARQMMSGVFKGFKTLTHEKITHRNINPNNLFFNDGVIKIKNFFCCKSPQSQKTFEPENYLYSSPEILLKTTNTNSDDKCDIFSLGLVFYKMIYGQLPYAENITIEQLTDLYRNQQFNLQLNDVSENTAQLLSGMLQVDVSRRIEWQTLFHEESLPYAPVSVGNAMNSSTNQNFASNYQINSQVSQQQFDTIGQNFYISQQSLTNHVTASPNELLKRRTTISDKENLKQNKENETVPQQTFAKTIEKEIVSKQIQGQLQEMRCKLQVVIGGILKIEQLDQWMAKIKPEICSQFLLKKAIRMISDMIDVTQNPDRQWSICKQKQELQKILQNDYEDLCTQFRQLKQNNQCHHEELNNPDMVDEQYVDNVLIMIAKQIAMEVGQVRSSMRSNSQIKSNSFNYEQTSQRNASFIENKQVSPLQYQFAIFLIDLVKGLEDSKQYFKRLEESKLSDVLDSKLKNI